MSRAPSIARIIPPLVALALLAAPACAGPSTGGEYHLAEGEVNEGDLWLFSGVIRIDGRQEGDLWVFGQDLQIKGVVTGSVHSWTQRVRIEGEVMEGALLFGQGIEVIGTVNGDLKAVGQTVGIGPGARVVGDLSAGGAELNIDGTVEGNVEATGGMIRLSGTVTGDAELEAETIEIAPAARIGGNLSYVTRHEIDLKDKGIVLGDIDWGREGDHEDRDDGIGFGWIFFLLAGLVVGLAALAIFSRQVPAIVARVGGDGLRSAGIGFLTFVVVPVAGLLACVLIVTIPLVFIAAVIFGLLVYLAKVPVATWIGGWIMARIGRPARSPYSAFLSGIGVLYLAFLVPYLGKLVWWGSLFVGLGAIVLYISDQRQQRRATAGAVPLAPPGSAPPAVQPS
jgi:cytoskeletal protein CcmA (bactofilin family)